MRAEDLTQTQPGWLSPDELASLRGQVPFVYVEAVPVRLDEQGRVLEVGLLLRAMPDGTVSRAVVSGRVLYGETVRSALLRHIEQGPRPRGPTPPASLTGAVHRGRVLPRSQHQRLPRPPPARHQPGLRGPRRRHLPAVPGLARLHLAEPDEADSPAVRAEMTGGQDRVVRLALAHAGCLG